MAKFELTRVFSRKDAARRAGPAGRAARAGHDDHAARLWQVLLGPVSAKPTPSPRVPAPPPLHPPPPHPPGTAVYSSLPTARISAFSLSVSSDQTSPPPRLAACTSSGMSSTTS